MTTSLDKYQRTDVDFSGSSSPLTLTTTIPPEILNHLHSTGQQSYIPLEPAVSNPSVANTTSADLTGALQRIQSLVNDVDSGVALRICIHELGSLDWGDKMTSYVSGLIVFPGVSLSFSEGKACSLNH